MAIKMDNHEITTLELHGANGQTVTKQLVEDGVIPTPTGKKNITDTTETDVTNYASAQVVDANLVPENIKKDVSVLGVVGTHEGGGETIYFAGARQYTANVVLPDTVTTVSGSDNFASNDMTELLSVSAPGLTSLASPLIRNPPNVEEVYLPRISKITQYVAYGCTKLKTVQLGSVGYPVDMVDHGSNGPLKGSGASDGLTVTVYVDAEALADETLVAFRAYVELEARHATFVYRNSVTGEVLS